MDEDFVRVAAANAGIIFNRPSTKRGRRKVCWDCYQKWVCTGKKPEEKPEVLGDKMWCCPECQSKDLRSLSQHIEAHSQP